MRLSQSWLISSLQWFSWASRRRVSVACCISNITCLLAFSKSAVICAALCWLSSTASLEQSKNDLTSSSLRPRCAKPILNTCTHSATSWLLYVGTDTDTLGR
ncbi:hypothetical protein J4Q44_G00178990 [Coregonus suidteri]|uniref:Uncharacterized protein n=1 Tax=Coregonus suidteri TaxID=861788 RepID=A0AAN8LU03_9TELE